MLLIVGPQRHPGGTLLWAGALSAGNASPEICNGIDDDCDGVTDEGCP